MLCDLLLSVCNASCSTSQEKMLVKTAQESKKALRLSSFLEWEFLQENAFYRCVYKMEIIPLYRWHLDSRFISKRIIKNNRLKKRITSRWHCQVSIRPNDPLGTFFAFGDETVEKSITTETHRVRGTTSTDPSKCRKSVFISVLKMVAERHTTCEKQVGKSDQVSWVLGMFVQMLQS